MNLIQLLYIALHITLCSLNVFYGLPVLGCNFHKGSLRGSELLCAVL